MSRAGRDASAPTLEDIRGARERIAPLAPATPVIRLEDADLPVRVYLKLENLQPIGSFKLRGALNRMLSLPRATLEGGASTASAGNMAQGVAFAARQLGVPATVIVPESAPAAKLDAIRRLGGVAVPLPYEQWWQAMRDHGREGVPGVFVHPFADRDVMAGNGTIGLELLEQVPDVDAVLVPWGGGGLACGIAAAISAVRPEVKVFACEVDGAAPLKASLDAGKPVSISNVRTFVDGIGGPDVFPEMWPLASRLMAGSLTAPLEDVAEAVRLLASRARTVAEGAGATSLAALRRNLRSMPPGVRSVVCIVSGGNINPPALASLLLGRIPE